jgi:hypothetical protein
MSLQSQNSSRPVNARAAILVREPPSSLASCLARHRTQDSGGLHRALFETKPSSFNLGVSCALASGPRFGRRR